MATLLETIRKNLPKKAEAPQLGQTETVRGLLRGKTGKQVAPSSGPRQSAVQEQVAARQADLASEQQAQTGMLQAEQFKEREADIAQRTQQQSQQFQQNLANMQQDFETQTNNILDQYTSGQKQLDTSEALADLEQVGIGLRFQNNQYIDQLKKEGQLARLDDDTAFRDQIYRNALEGQTSLLEDKLAFEAITQAEDEDWTRMLANLDLNYAVQLANDERKAQQSRAAVEGVAGLATAGAKAYDVFNKDKNDEDKLKQDGAP